MTKKVLEVVVGREDREGVLVWFLEENRENCFSEYCTFFSCHLGVEGPREE